jgi:hypothetical protein
MALNQEQLDFLTRLANEDVDAVGLVEINLHRFVNGAHATTVYRVSSRPFQSGPNDTPAFDEWVGQLRGPLSIERSVMDSLIGRGESTIGSVSSGSITLFNDDGELDELFGAPQLVGPELKGGYSPKNQAIICYLAAARGALRYADRIITASVIGGEARLTDVGCTIPVQSGLKHLDRTMVTGVLTKQEFPSLPDASVGSPKPEAWGTVYNVEPILVDPTNDLYYVVLRGRSILAARSGGLPIAAGQWQVISDIRGLMLRVTVAIPQGFKLTVDVEGSPFVNGNWTNRYADIVKDILDRHIPAAVLNAAGLTQLANSRPYDVGIYFTDPLSIREALLRLSRGLQVFFVEDRFGEIHLGALEKPTGNVAITMSDDTSLTSATAFEQINIEPIYGIEVRYRQLEVRQDEGQLAGLFVTDNPTYLNLLEYYKRGHQTLPFSEDAAALEMDPSATLGPYNTRLINATQARNLKNKIKELRGETTSRVRLTFDARGYQLRIHDEIRIIRKRMNLDSGRNYRILGIQDRDNVVTLDLWG